MTDRGENVIKWILNNEQQWAAENLKIKREKKKESGREGERKETGGERDLQCLTFHLAHLIRGVTLWSSGLWLLSAVITPPQHRKLLISQTAVCVCGFVCVSVCVGNSVCIQHVSVGTPCAYSSPGFASVASSVDSGPIFFHHRLHFVLMSCVISLPCCVSVLGSPLVSRSSWWWEWEITGLKESDCR